jgi:hypothetical protein
MPAGRPEGQGLGPFFKGSADARHPVARSEPDHLGRRRRRTARRDRNAADPERRSLALRWRPSRPGAPYRSRKLYERLTKDFAREVEKALIQEFGRWPHGLLLNRNCYYSSPSAQARDYIAKRKQLWRLPSISRIRISATAALAAPYVVNMEASPQPNRDGGFHLWLDKTELNLLDAVKEPDGSYSEVILWLADMDENA